MGSWESVAASDLERRFRLRAADESERSQKSIVRNRKEAFEIKVEGYINSVGKSMQKKGSKGGLSEVERRRDERPRRASI
jgi:hypothetical protein